MRRNSKIVLSLLSLFLTAYGIALLTSNNVFPRKDKIDETPLGNGIDDPPAQFQEQGGSNVVPIPDDTDIADVAALFRAKQDELESNSQGSKVKLTYQNMHRMNPNPNSIGGSPGKLTIPYKVVHLDFKGAPPKLSYLFSLFPLIREAGGNSLLLEYEDMFPFAGVLNGSSHGKAFTEAQVKELLAEAAKNELEVIPLIQTFGHLEFLLKLEQFSNLREVDAYPQEICPKKEGSWVVVKAMIDQVMRLHPKINYIHIGCDEVFHIGECPVCSKEREPKELFLGHVIRVAQYVRNTYKVIPIIWDDMLRKYYTEDLEKSGIGNWVEPMVWDYTENVDHLVSPYLWPMYGTVFKNIWAASAFKGAFGETLYQVDIQRHALNQLSWIKTLTRESPRIANFRGVAITGWSRYDHFSVLCELLPAAVPSLILSLLIFKHMGLEGAAGEFQKLFKCDLGEQFNFIQVNECFWPGRDLYQALGTLKYYENNLSDNELDKVKKGWLTHYNVVHNYTSPWRLEEPLSNMIMTKSSILNYEANLKNILRNYFEEYIVAEWDEQKLGPLKTKISQLLEDIGSLKKRRSWPRRPLSTSTVLPTSSN